MSGGRYLRNCWYAAAWDHEIGREPLSRTLLDEPVVLFRLSDGTPAALYDRCCHRGAPLSLGRIEGDTLQCGYHGLTFDAAGTCVSVPGQSNVPPGARVRAFPVIEKFRWVWIWMGDPERADPSLLPDWWQMEHPDWAVVKGDPPFHLGCHYELVSDNLLDLSHVAFVHDGSIGTTALADFPIETERGADFVRMTRWVMDSPPAPIYRDLGRFAGNIDRWQVAEARIPSTNTVHVGCTAAGAGAREGMNGDAMQFFNFNAITPETETTTHYFYAHARSFALGDASVDEVYRRDFRGAFMEDVTVLNAQQPNLDPAAPTIDIGVDGPGMTFRRLLAERIAAEEAAYSATT